MIQVPLTGQGIETIILDLDNIDTSEWIPVTYGGNTGHLLEINLPVPDMASLHLAHDSVALATPVFMLEANRPLVSKGVIADVNNVYRTSLDADKEDQTASIGSTTNLAFIVTPDVFRFNYMGIFVQTAAVVGKVIIYAKFK